MTKPWKLKTNSSNILLVLITLILIKAESTNGKTDYSWESSNLIEDNEGQKPSNQVQMFIGNDEIAQFFFHSSANNNSLILENVNKCLDNFQLLTCLKMLLLDRINNVVSLLEKPNVLTTDFYFLKGIFVFKRKNDTKISSLKKINDSLSLDEEISFKILKMFQNRFLQINLLPKINIAIEPSAEKKVGDFICFNYKIQKDEENKLEQGRKKSKGGMSMSSMLPQLIMLGFMPFTLASLKAMVMNAVMINMMALNGAIFMTIRNLVFGPRCGDNVKYVNYGYSKNRQTQSRRPVLIIHSPAAFVKQPNVRKKPVQPYLVKGTYSTQPSSTSGFNHNIQKAVQNSGNNLYLTNYNKKDIHLVQENEINSSGHEHYNIRKQTVYKNNNQENRNYSTTQEQQPNETKNINNYIKDFKYSYNNNVDEIYITSTSKPNVKKYSKNQKEHSNDSWEAPLYLEPENTKKNFTKSHSKENMIKLKPYKKSYLSVNNMKNSDFRPSPKWDSSALKNSFELKFKSHLTNTANIKEYKNNNNQLSK